MEAFFAIVIFIVLAIVVFKAVRIVPQGYEWTVESFGRYTDTLSPGLHFLIPVVQSIGNKVNMMEQVLDVPSQAVITKDNAVVQVDAVCFFQVLSAPKAAYEVSDLGSAMIALIQTNIRTVIGSMDLDESLSKREEINSKLLLVIDAATNPWGVKATRIEIKDITPPRDLIDSMARQMKAEREKRASILEAEGQRAAEILKAEGQRSSEILKAEGQKQSSILEAEGRREAAFRDAEARERLAQAEAEATKVVSLAIKEGETTALQYFNTQKYIEAFKALAEGQNSKFVLMPMESSSLVGTLGGLQQLLSQQAGQGR